MSRASSLALVLLAACGSEDLDGAQAAPVAPRDPARAWFTDVTEDWGLDFVHDAGLSADKHLPETMGAGAALLDADEDGDLDLYLVQGGPMRLGGGEPGTFRDPTGPLAVNRLYLNDGRGRMSDATGASGAAAHDGFGMGVACGDVDGDGHIDLYVTNLGDDVLLGGDGDAHFDDRTAGSGLADGRWTSAAVFFDAEGDGDLDLYVCAYVEVDLAHPLWCGGREPGWRSACHPDTYPGLRDRFWRNLGDGRFVDATRAAGLSESSGKALGVVAQDLDRDGDLDLYTANDSVENRLWENLTDGSFQDATLLSGTGVNERGATEAGMGIAVGDVDGDLDLDLFVTNFDDESNTLYCGEGQGLFRDRTPLAGLDAPSRLPVGFGTVLADFDHDGDLDLVVANGHIIDNIHLYHDGKTHAQRAQLFENVGRGRFRERLGTSAGGLCAQPLVGRGLYSGDLDGDSDLDLVLTQCGGSARILRNDAAQTPGWLVAGLPPGTLLTLTLTDGSQVLRTCGPQGSYLGQSASPAHFGSAPSRVEQIEIRAPYSAPAVLSGRDLPRPLGQHLRLQRVGARWLAR